MTWTKRIVETVGVIALLIFLVPSLVFGAKDFILTEGCAKGVVAAIEKYQETIAGLPQSPTVEHRAKVIAEVEREFDETVRGLWCPSDLEALRDEYLKQNVVWLAYLDRLAGSQEEFDPFVMLDFQDPAAEAMKAFVNGAYGKLQQR